VWDLCLELRFLCLVVGLKHLMCLAWACVLFWAVCVNVCLHLPSKVPRPMKARAMTLDSFVESMTIPDPNWTVSGL
jgi:hypothetical protein